MISLNLVTIAIRVLLTGGGCAKRQSLTEVSWTSYKALLQTTCSTRRASYWLKEAQPLVSDWLSGHLKLRDQPPEGENLESNLLLLLF